MEVKEEVSRPTPLSGLGVWIDAAPAAEVWRVGRG